MVYVLYKIQVPLQSASCIIVILKTPVQVHKCTICTWICTAIFVFKDNYYHMYFHYSLYNLHYESTWYRRELWDNLTIGNLSYKSLGMN